MVILSVAFQVLGLCEAYHGDTLGAMDAVGPSPFNGRGQTPWYKGRGLFLDPPTVAVEAGEWRVQLPSDIIDRLKAAAGSEYTKLEEELVLGPGSSAAVADVEAREGGGSVLAAAYRIVVEDMVADHLRVSSGAALGACIMEPVLQGAGGMRLIDPLFQRAVVAVARARKIPIIFDEVFTGFWRLGAPSGAALLGVSSDIACYAKLLTGGLVSMGIGIWGEGGCSGDAVGRRCSMATRLLLWHPRTRSPAHSPVCVLHPDSACCHSHNCRGVCRV
jgi:dethiobiotin synthetase/adenosylmethionine--8-amino-7-oxononanoate aminotransferase